MKRWNELILEEIFSDEIIDFQKINMLLHASMDQSVMRIHNNGIPISNSKTIVEFENKLDKYGEISGIQFPDRIDPKIIINRINKLQSYSFVSLHKMNNKGYEFPYYWIKIKRNK